MRRLKHTEIAWDKEQGNPHLWSIVLAGGEGKRLSPMIKQWLGEENPKQYCTFTGTRSMLQHTVDRADSLTDPRRRVTIVGAVHTAEATQQLQNRGGRLVVQPANRDTAPGIFLPLTYVRGADPQGTVVIYPSDHFVHPEEKFLEAVRHAVQAVDLVGERLIVLGMRPEGCNREYGHLQLDRHLGEYGGHSLWTIKRFIEKPGFQTAQEFTGNDVLWNTMVIVAKVETLWNLGNRLLPSMMHLFETFQPAIGSPRERQVLEALYERMPVRNFSMDIMEQIPNSVAAFEVNDVTWSDWGRVERIAQSLGQMGKTPVFPMEPAAVA